jgi:hypothetical protein
MAHARQADRALPQAAIFLFATLVTVIALGAIVAYTAFGVRVDLPTADRAPSNPALLESGRQWEVERRQQMGEIDPLTRYGRDWEKERRQQGGG